MNVLSDAIDSDFSKGTIINSYFNNIGGDAIDTSKSNIKLEKIKLQNVTDKGVSVGESSIVEGKEIEITKVKIGFAIKDESVANFNNIFIQEANFPIAVYIKKNEFGPANAVFTNVESDNNYLVQNKSSLKIDDQFIKSIEFDYENL